MTNLHQFCHLRYQNGWNYRSRRQLISVTQNDIKTANIGQQFHCVVCLGSNQKLERCVIKKVRTGLWEVLDEFGLDLIQHSHEMDEDETGPVHEWGVKFRMPTVEEIVAAKSEFEAHYDYQFNKVNNEIQKSPRRRKLHMDAYNSQSKQAKVMIKLAGKLNGDGCAIR
jgi:hypothetical protein